MKTNIPIYRAKKIDSDEYVEGYYVFVEKVTGQKVHKMFTCAWRAETLEANFNIDPSTLAIHFPDMIDSEGNKIFASLSEDGKGGDKLQHEDIDECGVYEATTVVYDNQTICFLNDYPNTLINNYTNLKVTGIQQ